MELTKDQQKGLDMMVKVLSKKYPYIIGSSPNIKDFEEYSSLFTIKLIVSKSKLEEHFKQKIDTLWCDDFFRFGNIFRSNPDPESLITEEIKRLGAMFYDVITDEYQFESDGFMVDKFRKVITNSFILDDKN